MSDLLAALDALTLEQLDLELAQAQATIDAAYWAFTRTARGLPPSIACPDAYERRRDLQAELRRRRRAA